MISVTIGFDHTALYSCIFSWQSWPENPNLGRWVSQQRLLRKNGKLIEERIRLLDDLGLVWEPLKSTWAEMFAALVEYEKANGDCNVPSKWRVNRQLGRWVSKQRQARKKGALSEDCIMRLDALGFRWSLRKGGEIRHSCPIGIKVIIV